MSAGENLKGYKDPLRVTFLFVKKDVFNGIKSNQEPVSPRSLTVEMEVKKFFNLFKRFSITLSQKGILNEREYTILEDD
jgi:hypothetical protein